MYVRRPSWLFGIMTLKQKNSQEQPLEVSENHCQEEIELGFS